MRFELKPLGRVIFLAALGMTSINLYASVKVLPVKRDQHLKQLVYVEDNSDVMMWPYMIRTNGTFNFGICPLSSYTIRKFPKNWTDDWSYEHREDMSRAPYLMRSSSPDKRFFNVVIGPTRTYGPEATPKTFLAFVVENGLAAHELALLMTTPKNDFPNGQIIQGKVRYGRHGNDSRWITGLSYRTDREWVDPASKKSFRYLTKISIRVVGPVILKSKVIDEKFGDHIVTIDFANNQVSVISATNDYPMDRYRDSQNES